MPEIQATTRALSIPRFVTNLDAIALARGLEVEHVIGPYSDDPQVRLWSRWKGAREAFHALGLLVPSQRLPLKKGVLMVPPYAGPFIDYLLTGDVTVASGVLTWEIDFGPADFELEQRGDLEVIGYTDEIAYHGTPEALVGAGIEMALLPLLKRPYRESNHQVEAHPAWRSRRQPDGMVVHRVETPSKFARRLAEQRLYREETTRYREYMRTGQFPDASECRLPQRPTATAPRPYLRLVVDNTRSSSKP